jgi:predicted nucleic acid-binding protein
VTRVVLDTDVASLSYKGRLPASLAAQLVGQEVCVTFVTIGELSRWAEKRRWGTRARTELVAWLGRAVVLPYDERVAWEWGGSASGRSGGAVPARSMTHGSRRAASSLTCRWPP